MWSVQEQATEVWSWDGQVQGKQVRHKNMSVNLCMYETHVQTDMEIKGLR